MAYTRFLVARNGIKNTCRNTDFFVYLRPHVLLQVGWDLELRCTHPATWNKDGQRLHHGHKYHVRNGNLVIRTPGGP